MVHKSRADAEDVLTGTVHTDRTDNPHSVTAAQVGVPSDAEFDDHSARHENGGADEINVAGLSGELADAQPPKTHASDHSDGGADEVKVEDLGATSTTTTHVLMPDGTGGVEFAALVAGDLPAHASAHQNGGGDEISVTGLSGLLADDQHVLDAEVTAVAVALAGGTMTGPLVMQAPIREIVTAVAIDTGNLNVDLSDGNVFYLTLDDDATIVLSNPPASGHVQPVALRIISSGGPHSLTFPAGDGEVPTVPDDGYIEVACEVDSSGNLDIFGATAELETRA